MCRHTVETKNDPFSVHQCPSSNRDVSATCRILCPTCSKNLLYWVDEWSDSIERVDLDGGHRHSIIIRPTAYGSHVQPWGIATFQVRCLQPLYCQAQVEASHH